MIDGNPLSITTVFDGFNYLTSNFQTLRNRIDNKLELSQSRLNNDLCKKRENLETLVASNDKYYYGTLAQELRPLKYLALVSKLPSVIKNHINETNLMCSDFYQKNKK
ncbi:MAG: hypothetical protein HRU03_04285 [Nanoarchaeales archaeon]|nr:hypothetical protein [Nanoarchaeales archaeon]